MSAFSLPLFKMALYLCCNKIVNLQSLFLCSYIYRPFCYVLLDGISNVSVRKRYVCCLFFKHFCYKVPFTLSNLVFSCAPLEGILAELSVRFQVVKLFTWMGQEITTLGTRLTLNLSIYCYVWRLELLFLISRVLTRDIFCNHYLFEWLETLRCSLASGIVPHLPAVVWWCCMNLSVLCTKHFQPAQSSSDLCYWQQKGDESTFLTHSSLAKKKKILHSLKCVSCQKCDYLGKHLNWQV